MAMKFSSALLLPALLAAELVATVGESSTPRWRRFAGLAVEAGTGVGKSFAYLLPAIEYAVSQKKRVVISTHTISLQEQLMPTA